MKKFLLIFSLICFVGFSNLCNALTQKQKDTQQTVLVAAIAGVAIIGGLYMINKMTNNKLALTDLKKKPKFLGKLPVKIQVGFDAYNPEVRFNEFFNQGFTRELQDNYVPAVKLKISW